MGQLTTAKTQLGVGGPTKNYARPIGAKALSTPPVRAITWIGLGGPGINRARPLGAKAEAGGGAGGGHIVAPFIKHRRIATGII